MHELFLQSIITIIIITLYVSGYSVRTVTSSGKTNKIVVTQAGCRVRSYVYIYKYYTGHKSSRRTSRTA